MCPPPLALPCQGADPYRSVTGAPLTPDFQFRWGGGEGGRHQEVIGGWEERKAGAFLLHFLLDLATLF